MYIYAIHTPCFDRLYVLSPVVAIPLAGLKEFAQGLYLLESLLDLAHRFSILQIWLHQGRPFAVMAACGLYRRSGWKKLNRKIFDSGTTT